MLLAICVIIYIANTYSPGENHFTFRQALFQRHFWLRLRQPIRIHHDMCPVRKYVIAFATAAIEPILPGDGRAFSICLRPPVFSAICMWMDLDETVMTSKENSMTEIRFDGRVAIVTGAGQGIGRIYALELAARGARVVVNDLGGARDGAGADQSAADRVVAEIREAGGEAVANYDSVATMQGGANIVQTAVDTYGKVDILINNAGILRDKSFLKMSEAEWDLVIAVHLKGAFCVTQPAVRLMKAANYGRVIFTSSTSGLYGNFGQTNYGAAKMGLVGLMNTLKLETANYNIKVNTVAPTAYSRMTSDIFPPDFEKKLDPQFNAPMVLYLASEANDVSGMTFAMGAGWYGRTAVVSGKGVCLGDGQRPIAPEEIDEHFNRIAGLDDCKPHDSGAHIFQYMSPLLGK